MQAWAFVFRDRACGLERTGETPWGDDFDVWLEAVKGELETDLVVSFAGATVRDVAAWTDR